MAGYPKSQFPGFLQTEYDRLFSSLFAEKDGYRRIVEVLSGNRYGLTREVLAEKAGIALRGTLIESHADEDRLCKKIG